MGSRNQQQLVTANGDQYAISSDGVTVWVDGPTGFVGRFGRRGIDLYSKLDPSVAPRQVCVFYRASAKLHEDWDIFVAQLKERYGIEMPVEFTPERFR